MGAFPYTKKHNPYNVKVTSTLYYGCILSSIYLASSVLSNLLLFLFLLFSFSHSISSSLSFVFLILLIILLKQMQKNQKEV